MVDHNQFTPRDGVEVRSLNEEMVCFFWNSIILFRQKNNPQKAKQNFYTTASESSGDSDQSSGEEEKFLAETSGRSEGAAGTHEDQSETKKSI